MLINMAMDIVHVSLQSLEKVQAKRFLVEEFNSFHFLTVKILCL